MNDVTVRSPQFTARMAGLFYLLLIPIGGVVFFARGKLLVRGDAAATATNILAHESLVQLAYAGDVLVIASYVVVTALLYGLLEPVNRSLSRLAACFSLVGCAIQGVACLFELAPSTILRSTQLASAFDPKQIQALAQLSLRLYSLGYNVGLCFFAAYCLVIGYLAFRSTFLPRVVGVLMMVAGLSWVTFLWPSLGARLYPYNLAGAVGEAVLTLWLLIAGVNVQRWREQASAGRPAAPDASLG